MSNTKREPLFSHAMMRDIISCGREDVDAVRMVGAVRIAGEYEVFRAKDAELIQQLVDALANLRDIHQFRVGREPLTGTDELAAAEAAGYKPSEQ